MCRNPAKNVKKRQECAKKTAIKVQQLAKFCTELHEKNTKNSTAV